MRFLRDNGLTIALLTFSILTVGGMLLTGWGVYNEELTQHGSSQLDLRSYALSGHFLSALFENWESEFLQMSAYVMLTAILFQRGSAESKDPDEPASQDQDPSEKQHAVEAPWPVRAGGMARSLYSYSLGIGLAILFILSFLLHLRYSAEDANAEALMHGQPAVPPHRASSQCPVLVRILPELAVGISVDRRAGGAVDLPEVQGFAGIKTRRGSSFRNW